VSSTHVLGILFALISAATWGGGDFSGGLATRRMSQFQALMAGAVSGLAILLCLALLLGEPIPSPTDILWSALAGVAAAVGVASLYYALAVGSSAIVAPTAAVIGATVPVLFGSLFEGLPQAAQLLGFLAGLLGIWLITRSASRTGLGDRQGLWSAITAGISFGGYFILIAQVRPGALFAPVIAAKIATLLLGLAVLAMRRERLPSLRSVPIALLAGILDAGGNIFYLLAQHSTRLDVAAVLSSMYPAFTVILAYFVLGERISAAQWVGVTLCIVAISLIAI
jgi:drug/metabolite transporter (DMT)-like permease